MSSRLWYPQLDVYDCIRRIGSLLVAYAVPPGLERLFISDFYVANPPLLHRSKMTKGTRQAFYTLKIPRPEKIFLAYPAPPLLFKKMESVQKEAVRAMTGKGLLSIEQYRRGFGKLTDSGLLLFNRSLEDKVTEREVDLISFITTKFAVIEDVGIQELRLSTGLRRTV